MPITMIGLDTAKSVFQIHAVDASGKAVLRRKLGRGKLLPFFEQQERCTVVLEACGAAHHRSRLIAAHGHETRLIAPEAVRPFVKKGKKNDAADAAAMCEAAARPDTKFVPTKSVEQQGILSLHSVRSLLIKQRTMLVNAMRGLATEFGMVAPKGISKLKELLELVDAADNLPQPARQAMRELSDRCASLSEAIETFEAEIVHHARNNEVARRLVSIPGIGPVTASLLVATVSDIGIFPSARHFAAWLGLVPRQKSTGGKKPPGVDHQDWPLRDSPDAGAGRHVHGVPGRAVEQRTRFMDQVSPAAPAGQAGDCGPGEQNGARRLGLNGAQRGLSSDRADRHCRASGRVICPMRRQAAGREPGGSGRSCGRA